MEKISIDDEWLYHYMPGACEKLLDVLPDEAEVEYEFSKKFQKKMEILLKRAVQKKKYRIPVTTGRRTAASIAVVLSAILMASLSVEAIRTEIFKFIQSRYESFSRTEYQIIKNIPLEFIPLYPKYIPEGYELDIKNQEENFLYLGYINKDNKGIMIQQEQIIDGLGVYEDAEYIYQKKVKVLGNDAILSKKSNGSIHVRWETESCICHVAADDLLEEDILKICNSLEK